MVDVTVMQMMYDEYDDDDDDDNCDDNKLWMMNDTGMLSVCCLDEVSWLPVSRFAFSLRL